MEVAAVTSMVLTNSAATQVETVLNSSAVIAFSFLTALICRCRSVSQEQSATPPCFDGGDSEFDELAAAATKAAPRPMNVSK